MINIEIKPAAGQDSGQYRSFGHARDRNICEAVTVIANCLAANLNNTWEVRVKGVEEDGRISLWWDKADRKGKGLPRANLAAGFAYTGLRALAKEYPDEVNVRWIRGGMKKGEEK